ncbi:DNA topoisomerase IB [Ramlibacter albus]|uniref:DNA topoisomerase IB n=1 Tax=Ramlibacter albus TaxID=2079448 RepID=UPI00338F47E1
MAKQELDDDVSLPVDPREAAEQAGLIYVSDEQPGIRREKKGDAFVYFKPNGDPVTDEKTLERVRKLAVPPAYTDVWICTKANGHIQATGRDARGRKQYRYHPQFREVRESTKYEHMMAFARALPAIRETLRKHMALRGLPREKVLATVVHLLETTLIRVGNEDYAKENKSYGLTTLRNRHVKVEGTQLKFQFMGKSGKKWQLQVRNPRVARIVRACQELPGQELFQYFDEDGEVQRVTSSDVNAYLREITGTDITAKDFRTWAGTVLAALALQEVEKVDTQAAQKKNIKAAIERVASKLGNTPTICRKCYVHPEVLQAYIEGELALEVKQRADEELREHLAELKPEEAAVLAMLEARLNRTLEGSLKASLAAARAGANARTGS